MQLAFFFLISHNGERLSNTFNIQNILQNIQNILLTVYLKIKQGHNRDVFKNTCQFLSQSLWLLH